MRIFVLAIVMLLAAAVGFGQKTQGGESPKYATADEVPRIALEDAKKAFDESKAFFIDSRPADTYKAGHIKGAVNIPLGSTDKFDSLPKNKKIIVYCSWPHEHTSAGLAFEMSQKGIANVFALAGGTMVWQNAGYPMTTGDKP